MNDENKPCLVETGQGLTVLYKTRYLYSRIIPAKSILSTVEHLQIKPETLLLCISPLLGYGLGLLLEKLPKNSFMLALEYDENLMALSAGQILPDILENPAMSYIRTSSVSRILQMLDVLNKGPFRRCVRLDLSGGASLYPDFYAGAVQAIDEYISRYWRNHLTIMKLGRNFARNMFRNCEALPESFAIKENSLHSPVFIAGAGPSLDASIDFIRKHRSALFLIAVDAAALTLHDCHIKPDAVVVVESQFWIERAFTGLSNSGIPVFADFTARNSALKATGGPISFFFSEYTKANFISRFYRSGILPFIIPPLGSVGLAAVYLARFLSQKDYPVLYSGLDFSYGKGYTHTKGAPSVREILCTSSRLKPQGTETSQLAPGVFPMEGKHNLKVFTDPSLFGYSQLFSARFPPDSFLVDIAKTGLPTSSKNVTEEEANQLLASFRASEKLTINRTHFPVSEKTIRDFIDSERQNLHELRNILTGSLQPEHAEERVHELITGSDYLFLHFPDGKSGYSKEKNFLKRVRIELDYFLKTLEHIHFSG